MTIEPEERSVRMASLLSGPVHSEILPLLDKARGMEFLVLDQIRPDIRMPVATVIVPGFHHFRERFAPGRLFDVPVELGWRDRPLAETELDSVPVIA